MRQLTAKQKKMLQPFIGLAHDWDTLPLEFQLSLEKVNDSEILPQEVSRYLWDKGLEV